jgi:hypothetical protein
MNVVKSKNGVPIRLTHERWFHITEEHSEIAGYYFEILEIINNPDYIYMGANGELIATKEIEPGKQLVVVYKEINRNDGFIITAFITRRIRQFERRARVWPQ